MFSKNDGRRRLNSYSEAGDERRRVAYRLPGLLHLPDAEVLQRDDPTRLLVLEEGGDVRFKTGLHGEEKQEEEEEHEEEEECRCPRPQLHSPPAVLAAALRSSLIMWRRTEDIMTESPRDSGRGGQRTVLTKQLAAKEINKQIN